MRGTRPFVFSNLKAAKGLDDIISFIVKEGMLQVKALPPAVAVV